MNSVPSRYSLHCPHPLHAGDEGVPAGGGRKLPKHLVSALGLTVTVL